MVQYSCTFICSVCLPSLPPLPPSLPSFSLSSLLAQAVFWHSTAHVLGEAMERHYGGCLCYGPPIENGFYYDMYMEGRYAINVLM